MDMLKENNSSKVIPIDRAVQILQKAEEEMGVTLSPNQRNAVVKILRKELEGAEKNAEKSVKELITAFKN